MKEPAHSASIEVPAVVRFSFLVVLTVASIVAVNPYQYGVADHSIVIPFTKMSMSPDLYPRDYLRVQTDTYYTVAWKTIGWIARSPSLNLSVVFFLLHCLIHAATFFAFYLLSKEVFQRDDVAVLSCCFFLFAHRLFADAWTLENMLLTRPMALPLVLLSLVMILRQRVIPTALLLGLGFLLHPLTVVPFVAVALIAAGRFWRRFGWKTIASAAAVFALVSLPLILWKIRSGISGDMAFADAEWVSLLRLRSSHHLFPFSWEWDVYAQVALLTGLYGLGRGSIPDQVKRSMIDTMLLGVLGLCLLGVLFSEFVPVTLVLELQLLRSIMILAYFSFIVIAGRVVAALGRETSLQTKAIGMALACVAVIASRGWQYAEIGLVVLGCFALIPGVNRLQFWNRWGVHRSAMVIVFLLSIVILVRHGFPVIANGQEAQWLDVQRWARTHTEHDALFFVPPTSEGFRVESERSIAGDWKDGTLLNFSPSFGREWKRRIDELGFVQAGSGGPEFRPLSESEYRTLAANESVKNKAGAYVVAPKETELGLPLVYENKSYRVFHLADSTSAAPDSSIGGF